METSWIKRNVPILSWLPQYNRSWLTADAIAGLTVWGLVVPESMAYAGVAGLPPQFGLYTLAVSLLVYAVLGSSRHLFVQPTSATAALIASTVTAVLVAMGIAASTGEVDPQIYQQYAGAFTLVVGLVFLAASLARLGFITQFLSKPVLDGFVTGLAVYVMVGQLNKLFGVEKPSGNTVQKFFGIVRELPEANWTAFALGATAMVLLTLIPRWNKKIPAGLIVLFGSIILSSALMLNANYGVEVVGELPQGLPSFSLPAVPLTALALMVAPAIGVLLVSFSQSLGVAREYSDKHDYEISPNTELTAFSAINLASGLFGGQIAGGSMAPSAVNDASGGRSEASSLVAWCAVILTLLFLTPIFKNLPETILAALIIHALWHIVASQKLRYARLVSRTEFVLGLLTFAGVIFIDVLEGMLIGLVSAILVMVFRSSRPHVSRLGKTPGVAGGYSDMGRHPENSPVPGVLIVRLDAPLYYANALTVRDKIIQMIKDTQPPPAAVLFDAAVQDDLDITSSDVLKSLIQKLNNQGIVTYFAEVHKPVLDFSARTGLLELIGKEHVFSTVDAAVRYNEATQKGDRK
jgi:sulfate permease, SulP family